MSNLLKVAMIETILSLGQRGWSQRRMARELGIDRETVARYLRPSTDCSKPAMAPTGSADRDGHSKPAIAPIGSTLREDASKPAIAPIGSGNADPQTTPAPSGQEPLSPGRPSDCEPWRATIQAKLDVGLSAQRIHQDLVAEHGFTGSYYSVRRFVRNLEETLELPLRRLECGPGEEAQIDFGSGAPLVLADGTRRRTPVFRIVLSHSRKGYSEAVLRQTSDDFLRCLENAFWHFGGVPQRLILDNLLRTLRQLLDRAAPRQEQLPFLDQHTLIRPLEDWGKLIGDVPSVTAILDRFLHHAEIVPITGKSYRLRHQTAKGKEVVEESKPAHAPTGSERVRSSSRPAHAPTGSEASLEKSKPANAPLGSAEGEKGVREACEEQDAAE